MVKQTIAYAAASCHYIIIHLCVHVDLSNKTSKFCSVCGYTVLFQIKEGEVVEKGKDVVEVEEGVEKGK